MRLAAHLSPEVELGALQASIVEGVQEWFGVAPLDAFREEPDEVSQLTS